MIFRLVKYFLFCSSMDNLNIGIKRKKLIILLSWKQTNISMRSKGLSYE